MRVLTAKRRLLAVFVVTVATVGTASVLASPAFSCAGGDPGESCGGVIRWQPSTAYTGGLAQLRATVQSVPSPSNSFVNQTMWIVTNNQQSGGIGGFPWIELGIKYGWAKGVGNVGRSLYWFESNTVPTSAMHIIGAASLSTNYNAKISYSGSDSWGVYVDGVQQGGTSHSQPC